MHLHATQGISTISPSPSGDKSEIHTPNNNFRGQPHSNEEAFFLGSKHSQQQTAFKQRNYNTSTTRSIPAFEAVTPETPHLPC